MSLTFNSGQPIAKIQTGKYKDKVIQLDTSDKPPKDSYAKITLNNNKLEPLLSTISRVMYIAGPSGSGKSTYASILIKSFKKLYPKANCYVVSRTKASEDPAFAKLKLLQIKLDESLITNPINIEDVEKGSLIIFDDVGTIADRDIKNAVFHLMEDIMEVGRRMKLNIIITNHLVNPNDKKFGRTVMNEMQSFTFFPRSGSTAQIVYALKTYCGFDAKQIAHVMKLPSRWITVFRGYPTTVMHENGVYILGQTDIKV